jgi:hypothetical protein
MPLERLLRRYRLVPPMLCACACSYLPTRLVFREILFLGAHMFSHLPTRVGAGAIPGSVPSQQTWARNCRQVRPSDGCGDVPEDGLWSCAYVEYGINMYCTQAPGSDHVHPDIRSICMYCEHG